MTRPRGMIHSAFRPSDDACIFPFLIPSNLFAVTSLEQLAEIYTSALSDRSFADGCRELAAEVRKGTAAWATGLHGRHGEIYAFEADGYGNQLFMDDGNAPSLLSLPYLGCCGIDDPRSEEHTSELQSP